MQHVQVYYYQCPYQDYLKEWRESKPICIEFTWPVANSCNITVFISYITVFISF